MAVPRQIVQAYFGKQSAKGTPATAPTHTFNVTGGKPFDHAIDEPLLELTGTSPGRGAADRVANDPGVSLPTIAHVKATGLPLYGILGGYGVSGAGPTYTHVFTAANEPLPYETIWGRYYTDYVRIRDGKCDTFTLAFDGPGICTVEQAWMGTTSLWADTPSAATHDESGPVPTAFRAAGGTFQLDVDGTTLATYCVESGSVAFNRNMTRDGCAASVTPDDHTAGVLDIHYSLTLVPTASLVDLRTIVTGTPTGTTPSSLPVYGAVSLAFVEGTNTLTILSNRVRAMMETPDADPGGGSARLVFEGDALAGTGVAQATVTLVNGVVTYAA